MQSPRPTQVMSDIDLAFCSLRSALDDKHSTAVQWTADSTGDSDRSIPVDLRTGHTFTWSTTQPIESYKKRADELRILAGQIWWSIFDLYKAFFIDPQGLAARSLFLPGSTRNRSDTPSPDKPGHF